jgi:4-amino-4-deoxy-L-arabinose transferase-like glycosyltransferase
MAIGGSGVVRSAMKKCLGMVGGALITFLGLTVKLDSVPPVWWDEGWTMTAVRNWVERGHYGPLLAGQPAPRVMEGAFPITMPVAVSFRVLGVGVWQARLVGVAFTIGTLLLVYHLASRLYDKSVALAVHGHRYYRVEHCS